MDAATALIGLGIFIVSAVVIYITSIFGTREKTYEEAIAEQRREAEQSLLLERQARDSKPKFTYTKNKAVVNKKSKPDSHSVESSPSNSSENIHRTKSDDKLKKKDKPKSEAKQTSAKRVPSVETATATHLNEVKVQKTKSDGNLKPNSSNSKGDQSQESKQSSAAQKSDLAARTNSKEIVKTNSKEFVKQDEYIPKSEVKENKRDYLLQTISSPVKKPKKSKSDLNSHSDQIVNMPQIITQLKETVLTSNEIQTLIDVLLNKQQGDDAEWLQQGQKQDSVSQLKKKVADLEQQVQEQVALTASATSKVREIRNESNQDKARSAKLEKEFKDKMARQDQDMASLKIQLQQTRDLHSGDVSAYQEKLRQYESKMCDTSNIQKLQDEIAILKKSLAQASAQAEKDSAVELSKFQEETELLRKQNEALENERAALNLAQQQLREEIKTLQVQLKSIESETGAKGGEFDAIQSQMRDLQAEIERLKGDLELELNINKELPELRREVLESQEKLNASCSQKSNLEQEVQKLLSDLQEVKSKVQEQEIAINVVTEEKVGLMGQLAELQVSLEASNKQNGDVHPNEDLEANNQLLTSTVAEKEKAVKSLTEELLASRETVEQLRQDLETKTAAIKNFHYDMDAKLQQLEDLKLECCQRHGECERLRADLEDQKRSQTKIVEKTREEEECAHKALLSRLFPIFDISSELPYATFMPEFEKRASDLLDQHARSDNKSEDLLKRLTAAEENNATLESEVEHYKTVMTETESILSKLQCSVEEEEDTWRQKLKSKDDEINRVKQDVRVLEEEKSALEESLEQIKAAEEMQEKLRELQAKLQSEENDRRSLESKYAKEIERLECDISTERETNKELKSQTIKLNSLVKIGEDSLRAEQEIVKDLQLKLEATMGAAANGLQKGPNTVEHVESSYNESKPSTPTQVLTTSEQSPSTTPTSSKKHKRKSKRSVPAETKH